MDRSIIPVAGAALVFGMFNAMVRPSRIEVASHQPAANPHSTLSSHQKSALDDSCTSGTNCADPVDKEATFAEHEGDRDLRIQICGFLAEYGKADSTLQRAEAAGYAPPNSYCSITALQSAGIRPGPGFAVNPAARPRVLIAILPDPVHSQLALRFDEATDELQNSAQDAGWTYDRAWLPWDNKEHEEAKDFEERMEDKVAQEHYELSPGAIMFRPNEKFGTTRPLIFIVVGDTPTGGVNASAFHNAVAIWRELVGWKEYIGAKADPKDDYLAGDAANLDIIGPTYTGSLPSLEDLLQEIAGSTASAAGVTDYSCPAHHLTIRVISGTVSDGLGLKSLGPRQGCDRIIVTGQSMMADSIYENERIRDFLVQHLPHRLPHPNVATLSEAESNFGAGIEPTAPNVTNQALPPHFYFPRGISSLRTAYEQNNIFGFSSPDNSAKTQLRLSLSGNTREDDTVHTFSGLQHAAAQETELAQVAYELTRQQISTVVLTATDVLDALFLTRYLAQHAPNVSVVITTSDVMFLRAGDSSIQNAYVISPWPLIPGNEEWANTPNDPFPAPRRIHDSAAAQGLYSATRMLLCTGEGISPINAPTLCGALPVSNIAPARRFSLREYQLPVATWAAKGNELKLRPPLWLSVISRGQFWPISLVDIDQANGGASPLFETLPPIVDPKSYDSSLLPPVQATGINEITSSSILLATGIVAVLLAFHGVACLRARLDRNYAWTYALSDKDHHKLRQLLQIGITLSAIPALVLLKTPVEAGVHLRYLPYTSINWGLQLIASLFAVWTFALITNLWYLLRRGYWQSKCFHRYLLCSTSKFSAGLALMAAFVYVCNRYLWDLVAPSANKWPTERAFIFYRSAHILSGASPNLPILLLGAALVFQLFSSFDHFIFYKDRIPVLPNKIPGHSYPSNDDVRPLNNLLSKRFGLVRLCAIGSVMTTIGIWILGFPGAIPLSITHGNVDWVIDILTIAVVFLLLYNLVIAGAAWYMLRSKCLLPLRYSSVRWGFNWIKGWSWRRLWAPGPVSADGVLEHLRRLRESNSRALKDPDLDTAFLKAGEIFSRGSRDARWASRFTQSIGRVNDQLAISAFDRLSSLSKDWVSDHGPITGSSDERGLFHEIPSNKLNADKDDWTKSLDRVAREEFVALLYLGYIRMVLLQVRSRVLTAICMFILLLWATTSYPFLNHHLIIVSLTILFGILSIVIVWIYSQMHRDDILSRTTETTDGKLGGDFFVKMLSLIGLPLLTLIASQLPEVSNFLLSWVEPSMASIK